MGVFMLKVGLIISGIGVVLYIVSAILMNYYLRRNRPDILKAGPKSSNPRKKREARIIVTQNASPGGVSFLGFLAMPIFLIGIGTIILSLIIKAFGRIF